MSLIPKELDEKRLASFKASLLNLRGAILDQHRRHHIRRQGGVGGGGGVDGANPPSRQQQHQQQQQQQPQQQARPSSPSNPSDSIGNRDANPSSPSSSSYAKTTQLKSGDAPPPMSSSWRVMLGRRISGRLGGRGLPQLGGLPSRIKSERDGLLWVLGCAAFGLLVGFAVGAGWLTLGSGSHRLVPRAPRNVLAMSSKANATYVPSSTKRDARRYVPDAWRVRLAGRVRSSATYRVVALRRSPWGKEAASSSPGGAGGRRGVATTILARSPLWPPNWIIFRDVDTSGVDPGAGGGLHPLAVRALCLLLPWRREVLRKLVRRDRVRIDLRDGRRYVERSPSFASSILSSMFPSGGEPDRRPVNPYHHPMAFHALREYVVRFDGGYVHPDLGLLVPAPSGEFGPRESADAMWESVAFLLFSPVVLEIDYITSDTSPSCGILAHHFYTGADRGLGMVRDTYSKCQVHCFPGTAEEKLREMTEAQARLEQSEKQKRIDAELMEEMMKEFPDMVRASSMAANANAGDGGAASSSPGCERESSRNRQPAANDTVPPNPARNTTTYAGIRAAVKLQQSTSFHDSPYAQSEILLRIPLEAQITRKSALETLMSMLPPGTNGLEELDDAFVLALYLAHERGLGVKSRIWPYVATLPPRPTCALHWGWRQSVVDVVTAMSVEMGTDVLGWPTEIAKAAETAELIVTTLASATVDMNFARRPGTPAEDVVENIRWALCQVASRAIAGRDAHGSLRLVPVMDMINHDAAAGKFMELTGKEKLEDGSLLDADENHAGTFVVTSRRHDERKPLKRGQELMANYNVPNYSPLDWFINMGYIPPERAGKWTMLEAALPRNYRGGFSRNTKNVVTNNAPPNFGAFGSEPKIEIIRQHS